MTDLLRSTLLQLRDRHGSWRAAGRVLRADHTNLYRISRGQKIPSDALLKKLKLKRITAYVPIGWSVKLAALEPQP